MLLDVDTIDIGLLPPTLELGRCCHDSVPDLARLDALGEGLDPDMEDSAIVAGLCVDGVLDCDLLPDPKPLNSGMLSVDCLAAVSSIVSAEDCGGVIGCGGGDDVTFCTSVGDFNASVAVAFGALTGLIDFARSTPVKNVNVIIHSLIRFSPKQTPNSNHKNTIENLLPALLFALSCRPRSISSSNFLYLSASSLSLFSESSRTDFKKAAGSRSLSRARCSAEDETEVEDIIPAGSKDRDYTPKQHATRNDLENMETMERARAITMMDAVLFTLRYSRVH